MDKWGKDLFILIAIELDYPDILNLCMTNKKLNNYICGNNYFWKLRNDKLYDYPFLENNYQKDEIEKRKLRMLKKYKLSNTDALSTPRYIKSNLYKYLKNTNFGSVNGFPINYLISSLIHKNILSSNIIIYLLMIDMFNENKRTAQGFSLTNSMKYYFKDELSNYAGLDGVFRKNKLNNFVNELVYRTKDIPNYLLEKNNLKDTKIVLEVSQIEQILKEYLLEINV